LSPSPQVEFVEVEELPTVLKGSRHCFNKRTRWRWLNPVFYQDPGYEYIDKELRHRHRDAAGREAYRGRSDRYLHVNSAHLRNLYVACTDDIYEAPGTSTWKRTYVQKVASMRIRLATWVLDFNYKPKNWSDWAVSVLRSLPVTLAMSLWVSQKLSSSSFTHLQFYQLIVNQFWEPTAATPRNNGSYASVLYTYHGSPKVWSNLLENRKGLAPLARTNQVYSLLKPRHLCFLRDPLNDQASGWDSRLVAEWEETDGQDEVLRYMFVAYSTKHFDNNSRDDMRALHLIAETACRAAKLPAFWVAGSCMRDDGELESDVSRSCLWALASFSLFP
jgi:hypothetical protein